MTAQKAPRKVLDVTVWTVAVLGILVLLNVIGLWYFGQVDLTRDKQFTLSRATRDTVASLTDVVRIKAYFTHDLPAPFSTNERYVRDMLGAYTNLSKGKIQYEILDPLSLETEADKAAKKETKRDVFGQAVQEQSSVEKQLQDDGIPAVQVRGKDGEKFEVRKAYMGISLKMADRNESIPVVQDTNGLEYGLTTALRKISHVSDVPGATGQRLGILTGHDSPSPQDELNAFVNSLAKLYDVTFIDFAVKPEVPKDLPALLVIGPKTALSEVEQRAIDDFLMLPGRSVGFFVSPIEVATQNLKLTPTAHGLAPMIQAYGITIQAGLALDTECMPLSVATMQGEMRVQQQVSYPLIPAPKELDPNNPITRGMGQVFFPFMSPLAAAPRLPPGVTVEPIVTTSKNGWTMDPINLDPMVHWTKEMMTDPGPKPIIMSASGPIASFFDPNRHASDARVLVAGGAAFLTKQSFVPGNAALVGNMVDWLTRDDAVLEIRSRGLAAAPISPDLTDSRRETLKYLNIVGVPLLFALLGLVRWRLRESRRGKVSLA